MKCLIIKIYALSSIRKKVAGFFTYFCNFSLVYRITYYTEGTYRSYLAKGKLEKFKPAIYDVIVYRNSTYHSSTSPLPPGGLTSMTGKTKGLTFQGIFHGMGFRNLPSFMIKALQYVLSFAYIDVESVLCSKGIFLALIFV